jgi:hypothetical protein
MDLSKRKHKVMKNKRNGVNIEVRNKLKILLWRPMVNKVANQVWAQVSNQENEQPSNRLWFSEDRMNESILSQIYSPVMRNIKL